MVLSFYYHFIVTENAKYFTWNLLDPNFYL